MQELFHVASKIRKFRGCKGVLLSWFVDERSAPLVAYGDYIADYENLEGDLRSYAESSIDELFTQDEALTLLKYILGHDGEAVETVEIERASLPVSNTLPHHATPLDRFNDHILIWKRPGYDLPFKVAAAYDLRFSGWQYTPTTTKLDWLNQRRT
jgi:hypothetical protein